MMKLDPTLNPDSQPGKSYKPSSRQPSNQPGGESPPAPADDPENYYDRLKRMVKRYKDIIEDDRDKHGVLVVDQIIFHQHMLETYEKLFATYSRGDLIIEEDR